MPDRHRVPEAAAQRRAQVAELALNGFSQRQIARQVNVSLATVNKDLIKIRRGWAEARSASYEEHVARQMARLDQLERVIARRISEGELAAIDRGIKILDRRAALLGLDAPSRHEVVVDDPISAEIRVLAGKLGLMNDPAVRAVLGPSAGDIVDAEVVEDDHGTAAAESTVSGAISG